MNKSAILIDDNWFFLRALRRQFEAVGWKVETFTDLADGFERVAYARPDLVVVDYNLGTQGTGLDFLRGIETMECERKIVVLTGEATIPKAVAAIKLGAAGFLSKPATVAQILEAADGKFQLAEGNPEHPALVEREVLSEVVENCSGDGEAPPEELEAMRQLLLRRAHSV